MKFYSVQERQNVEVDDKEIEVTTMKNGRKAAKATANVNGKQVKLFRILGKEDLKRLEIEQILIKLRTKNKKHII